MKPRRVVLTIEVETDLPLADLRKVGIISFTEDQFIHGNMMDLDGFTEAWKMNPGTNSPCVMDDLVSMDMVLVGVVKQVQVNVVDTKR